MYSSPAFLVLAIADKGSRNLAIRIAAILLKDPHDQNNQNQDRHHIGKEGPHPLLNLHALTSIGFLNEGIPSPALLHGAEEDEDQSTDWKDQVADQEILEVKEGRFAQGMNAGKHVVAQGAGQG